MKKPELLAPVGSEESLYAALRFGADAIYLGGSMLQLRAKSAGFDDEALTHTIATAHEHGARAYVTCNSLANEDEISAVGEYAKRLHAAHADAAIVSDLGVLASMREACPELELHLSTQASCCNHAAARVYHELGIKRIVLAREMTLVDIRRLRDAVPPDLELEAFVHGAMCMAYSGRCLMSAEILKRSGNRGDCAQPCRWNYALMEEKRPGEYFPVFEEDGKSAILSSKDLNCIDILNEIRDAGVDSFKIEGRMKTGFYVATVVSAYRHAIDGDCPIELCKAELNAVSHRPYTTGFYKGDLPQNHSNDGAYVQDYLFAGSVLSYEDGFVMVRQRNHFEIGDVLEVVSPRALGLSFPVTQIYDMEGELRENAPHPLEILKVACPIELEAGDFLRRRAR